MSGSGIAFDTAYFNALTARIDNIDVCADLQTVIDEVMASINAEKAAIEAQVLALEPVLALLALPTDLGSAISWIGKLVTTLINPLLKPLVTYATQLEGLASAVVNLTTAIQAAEARIVSCSVTIPAISVP